MTNKTNGFRESSLYVGLLLSLITMCCLGIVFAVKDFTADSIRQADIEKQNSAFRHLLNGVKFDNNPSAECYLADGFGSAEKKVYVARSKDQVTAYVVYYDVTGGYSTPFSMVAGVGADGIINYVDVVEFNETPGLGDKILRRTGNYLDSFTGTGLSNRRFDVKKDGGDFDYFTGATVTPRAVVRSTRAMLERIGTLDLGSLKKCEAEK